MTIAKMKFITFIAAVVGLLLGYVAMRIASDVTPDLEHRPAIIQRKAITNGRPPANLRTPVPMQVVFDRPLFQPLRRPFVAVPPAVVVEQPVVPESIPVLLTEPVLPAMAPPAMTLKGVKISAGSSAALIVTPEIQKGKWMKIGDIVADWKLVDITPGKVKFSLGSESHILQLYVDNPTNNVGNLQQGQ